MYQTLKIDKNSAIIFVTINRPAQRNSINRLLLEELQQILAEVEQDVSCRFIVLQGQEEFFCTGMDFEEMTQSMENVVSEDLFSSDYMSVLKSFTTTSKVVISLVDGQVLAGGVGLVAASDFVFSTRRSKFGLSEALWGLLPACVTPFLIRRVGFQKAYTMTLSAETISAEKAYLIGLIDQLTDNLSETLRHFLLRLNRVEEETVKDLKTYFHKMWIINEAMESTAVVEISRLVNKPKVKQNIKNFVNNQSFPWEKQTEVI